MKTTLRGLSRTFGEVTALDRVDLDITAGETVALLGENGAGKSTLVEILGGILRPDAGVMTIDSEPYAPRDARAARRSGISVVHQHFQLVENFTVSENLQLLGANAQQLGSEWQRLADELGLELPALDQRVQDLGVGQRQWLEIGKALLWRPSILLLDEPTAVLTPKEADQLFAMIRKLAEQAAGIVLITHRLDEVRRIAQRTVILRRGRVVFEGSAQQPSSFLAEKMTGDITAARPRPRHCGDIVARLRGVACPHRLNPLDLDLRSGEITVFAGVDGNGQAAAAERLAGLTEGPGDIEIDGLTTDECTPRSRRDMGVVVIPGDRIRHGIAPGLDVAENLVLGRRDISWRARRQEARHLIDEFAIVGEAHQPAGTLSGGNQQKIVVARNLATKPRVLVAVHPTRGLDIQSQQRVHEALFKEASRGTAVVAVTSDIDEARSLGDRVIVFSRGQVIGEGDRDTAAETIAHWVAGERA